MKKTKGVREGILGGIPQTIQGGTCEEIPRMNGEEIPCENSKTNPSGMPVNPSGILLGIIYLISPGVAGGISERISE